MEHEDWLALGIYSPNRVVIRKYCGAGCDCPTCHTGRGDSHVEECVYCQLKWANKDQYNPRYREYQGWEPHSEVQAPSRGIIESKEPRTATGSDANPTPKSSDSEGPKTWHELFAYADSLGLPPMTQEEVDAEIAAYRATPAPDRGEQ